MTELTAILDIERMILATMMLRPGDCGDVDILPEQFSVEAHGQILATIRERTAESLPVDPVSIADYYEVAGKKVLAKLAMTVANTVTTAVPEAYASRIVQAWRSRKAREIGATLSRSNAEADVDAAIEALMALHQTEAQHEFTAKQSARAAYQEIVAIYEAGGKLPGITTGLRDLDDRLGGFHRSDLIVVGGRAAMGKTSFLLGAAVAAAKAGNPVGIISGEQPAAQIGLRMIASASNVPAAKFRVAKIEDGDWTRIASGTSDTANLPLWMLDRSNPSMAEIVRVARRWKHRYGIKALYVDYLQRVQADGERKFEQVGNAVRGLKNLARDLDIPIVVLAQVSRQVEVGGKGRMPRMADLSDSSEIEKEADQILMLYREAHYDDKANPNIADVLVEKNRHGPTGKLAVAWRGQTMTFGDLDHGYAA